MSDIRQCVSDSCFDRLASTGENGKNLVDGSVFVAEYTDNPPEEMREALGIDIRESGKMFIYDPVASGKINITQKISLYLLGIWKTFTITRRVQPPGESYVEFGLNLIIAKDQ